MTQHINITGLELIKRFEGLTLTAIPDTGSLYQIGYGHTHGVRKGDTCTEAEAEAFLRDDLQEAELGVDTLVNIDLNPNQFSALVCLVYNIGTSAFAKSSLCRLLNDGQVDVAANEFRHWNHVGGKTLRGLTRRRQAEEELFRRPIKPLSQSRIMKAGTIATASTAATGVTDTLDQTKDMLYGLAPYVRLAEYALVAITLGSLGYILYARWDDHRRSVR